MALTQIKTDAISDDAVTLAKQAAGTDGQIITYDASGNPTAVGPGTDGQVLTSTGANSAPAFEDLPTSGVTVSNNSNNRVATGDGSNLNAEANLTFDGDHLTQTIDADGEGFNQTASGNHYIKNEVDANRSSASASILSTVAKWNGKEVAGIKFTAGGDTTNKDDGRIIFETSTANDIAERVRIDTEGKVGIGTSGPLKLLTVKAASNTHGLYIAADNQINNGWGFQTDSSTGHLMIDRSVDNNFGYRRLTVHGDGGICFQGDTAAANALDDYEEGTWTPRLGGGNNIGTYNITGNGHYTKVGRMVFCVLRFTDQDLNNSASGTVRIDGLPFTPNAGGASPEPYSIFSDFLTSNGYFNNEKNQAWEIQSGGILVGLQSANGAGWSGWSVGDFDLGGFYMNGSFSYIAT